MTIKGKIVTLALDLLPNNILCNS